MTDEERGLDPQRHLNRLIRAICVSTRIQKLAQAKINQEAWNEEKQKEEEQLELAKETRAQRIKSLDAVHTAILEMVSSFLDISIETAVDGIADSDLHLQLMKNFTTANGCRAIIFTYALYPHPEKGNNSIIRKMFHCRII